jgi:hypothetical protein
VIYCQFFFQVSFEGDLAPMIRGSDRPDSVTIYRGGGEEEKGEGGRVRGVRKSYEDRDEGGQRRERGGSKGGNKDEEKRGEIKKRGR